MDDSVADIVHDLVRDFVVRLLQQDREERALILLRLRQSHGLAYGWVKFEVHRIACELMSATENRRQDDGNEEIQEEKTKAFPQARDVPRKDGDQTMRREMVGKAMTFPTVTASRTSEGEASMTVSTITPDREGDRVIPEGVVRDGYLRNPVLLWGHEHSAIPIGTVTALDIEPGRALRARWRWLEGDEFAERVRNAWDQGVVRASSIGFLPREGKENEYGGYDFTEWELLEISLVAVPANAEATRRLNTFGLATSSIGQAVLDRVNSPRFTAGLERALAQCTPEERDLVGKALMVAGAELPVELRKLSEFGGWR